VLSSLVIKRAFWLLDIALFLCTAFLGVQIFKAFTAPPPNISSTRPNTVSTNVPRPARNVKPIDYSGISTRRVFGEAGMVAGVGPGGARTGSGSIDSLPATSLNLRLLGTVVGTTGMGKALIEDQTSKSAKLYREGEKVAPMTAVEQILAKKVILNRDGAREVLLLGVTEATPGARISSSAQMVARLPSLPAGPPGMVTVDRSEWMNKGLEEIIGEGKVTAVWKDGQIEGLKVTNIARNEYAQTLGLRENDVVVSINGVPLRSTDEALALAEKLQKAPVVRVQVLRNGRPEVLTYRMSDLGGLSRQRGRP